MCFAPRLGGVPCSSALMENSTSVARAHSFLTKQEDSDQDTRGSRESWICIKQSSSDIAEEAGQSH